ncbi:GNAT family N-acetyltransferase [Micromonospora polyrhachis]|uniref:GNAT superfamily N-acetyltransferase n=1 Tax=Micromonospora polyrhachis TaxID=1282883 RepID=A0A7W7WQA1_9ACTN|nr:GNAT superfamily N-acetyltransferase [Micromonospora polyrhachis]
MEIRVVPLDVTDDAAVERSYEIVAASDATDMPDLPPLCRQGFIAGLRHPMPGNQPWHGQALLDGMTVGHISVELPTIENTDNAGFELRVHPNHRRQGVGRALYEHARRLVLARGRKRIVGSVVAGLPGGPAWSEAGSTFAAAMGAKAVLTEVRRRLDVTAVDQPALDRVLAEARRKAEGYSLVQWAGMTPDAYLDDVAYLDGRLLQDAPMGDLEWEPSKVDANRIQAAEQVLALRGIRHYHSGMRHDASGRLVAWSLLNFAATSPWHAYQQITIVDPAHRGHRLGAIVKIENLRYALDAEPELSVVDTWNAAANDHMISINEAMGFRPVDNWTNWQQAL